ncbi:MAG TPA: HAMP domain-containing protein, partial [Novosphingobium sp.]|nr:HAMP domain-containing protein [Novosphingobium sp.]
MRKLLDLRMAEVRQTTTFRLTAALGIVFLVAVVALLGITYALTESEQAARSDLVLYREAQLLASAPPGKRVAAVNAAVTGNASGLLYFALYDAAGRKLAGNVNFDARKQSHAMPERTFERPAGGGLPVPMRMLVRQLGDGETLVLGRDNKTTIDLRARILGILLASGLAVVASAAAAAVGLSIGPLRRIGELKVAARRIAAGELGWRMPVSRRMDELDLIAGMVNTMIDEIERLMEQVKGATDAIAHDLRAPLARL